MRIILAADSHGGHRYGEAYWPKGDILFHAGDITNTGGMGEVKDFVQWAGREQTQYKDVVFVAGNHDLAIQFQPYLFREYLQPYQRLHYLQDESLIMEGLHIYGSPWQPMFGGTAFNLYNEKELLKKWQMIPKDVDILLTHTPPRNILDSTHDGEKCGSISLLTEIFDRIKPKLHVFGHIHQSSGIYRQEGITFVNAANTTIEFDWPGDLNV